MLIIVSSVCQLAAHDWAKIVLWRGGVGSERLTDLLYLMIWGPWVPGCMAVWSWADTAGSVKSSPPLGQKQHSFSGSNGSITLSSTSETKELLCHSISNRDKQLDNLQGQCHQNLKAAPSMKEFSWGGFLKPSVIWMTELIFESELINGHHL